MKVLYEHARIFFALFVAITSGAVAADKEQDKAPVYDIPRMEKIVIDGNTQDWGAGGFRVDLLAPLEGEIKPAADHAARFRLAWNEEGLLLLVSVRDDVAIEHEDEGMLWRYDCIETFLAPRPGATNMCQWVIAPGMTNAQSALRVHLHDYRKDEELKKQPAKVRAARAPVMDKSAKPGSGYTLEALLPWSSLRIKPELGREAGFQLYINDVDRFHDPIYHVAWFPSIVTAHDTSKMHTIRLAEKPSPGIRALATGEHDIRKLQTRLTVLALSDQAGKLVSIMAGGKVIAKGMLADDGVGRTMARLRIPFRAARESSEAMLVHIDGKEATALKLPAIGRVAAEAILMAGPNAVPRVFAVGKLPEFRFDRPLWVEELIGPYELQVTYYDADYNIVDRADEPGRYGAVIEVVPEQGTSFRRFRTLLCLPQAPRWWRVPLDVRLLEPDQLGISPGALKTHAKTISEFAMSTLAHSVEDTTDHHWDPFDIAGLLAGLQETDVDVEVDDFYTNPRQLDRQWWVGLKRRLYGFDKTNPEPFVCPRLIEGDSAPVVRKGSLKEAGMKRDARRRIDSVLKTWAADTDEAFAVCIVRHGVIVLHKAYGMRDGQRMTVDTKSWMASTTKMLSGSLMMMLVDQGLIGLDDRVDKYLPPLQGLKTNKPLTIRRLYNHTNGMDWHWGNHVNDMEERMASLVPFLEIGKRYAYNGTGMELGCKILELISGESLPNFYKKHLLDPLGCENTAVGSASHDADSVPLDMARICQMLLNKGTYGNMRFMREETFEQMLPLPLDGLTASSAEIVYGVGTTFSGIEELGEGAFEHGAASSASSLIDPVNDLIVVMTRNSAGLNFNTHHPLFIKAIVESMAE